MRHTHNECRTIKHANKQTDEEREREMERNHSTTLSSSFHCIVYSAWVSLYIKTKLQFKRIFIIILTWFDAIYTLVVWPHMQQEIQEQQQKKKKRKRQQRWIQRNSRAFASRLKFTWFVSYIFVVDRCRRLCHNAIAVVVVVKVDRPQKKSTITMTTLTTVTIIMFKRALICEIYIYIQVANVCACLCVHI